MSKKEEILHKLSTEDRNYIKEKFKEKDEEIKTLKKALELACDTTQFEDTCDYCRYNKEVGCPCYCETDQHFSRDIAIEYFKNQAKEMLKDENKETC